MKEYKLVYLNKGIKFSREKDIEETENTINEYATQGWELQQVISPNDLGGAMIGIFYKEKWENLRSRYATESFSKVERL